MDYSSFKEGQNNNNKAALSSAPPSSSSAAAAAASKSEPISQHAAAAANGNHMGSKKKEFGEVVLELREIGKSFPIDDGKDVVHALKNVSISDDLAKIDRGFPSIRQGEFVMIRGPSGGGKTTLLNIIGTIDLPTQGVIKLLGNEITKDSEDDLLSSLRLRHIGFVFQTFNLLSTMSALENVELPMTLLGELSEKERRSRAKKLLALVGLRNRIHHLPSELSGGEQQRVTIARSLANNPGILLLDEPTGDLDTATTISVMDLLSQINYMSGVTCIMVTHNPDVETYADRILYVEDGRFNRQVINEEPLPLIRDEYEEYLKKVDNIPLSNVTEFDADGPVKKPKSVAGAATSNNGNVNTNNTNGNNNGITHSFNDHGGDDNFDSSNQQSGFSTAQNSSNGDANKPNHHHQLPLREEKGYSVSTSAPPQHQYQTLNQAKTTVVNDNPLKKNPVPPPSSTSATVTDEIQSRNNSASDDHHHANNNNFESLFVRPPPSDSEENSQEQEPKKTKRQDSDFDLVPVKNSNKNNKTNNTKLDDDDEDDDLPSWRKNVQKRNHTNGGGGINFGKDDELPPVKPPASSTFPPPKPSVDVTSPLTSSSSKSNNNTNSKKKKVNDGVVGMSDL